MLSTDLKESFISLVRLGIGTSKDAKIPNEVNWTELKALAEMQGLSEVVLDGVEVLKETNTNLTDKPNSIPPIEFLLEWIGETLQNESIYVAQQTDAVMMADLFQKNGIRTYVLKGAVVSECYPKPSHRQSADMDCYLLPEQSNFDAWNLGNDLIKAQGFEVAYDFYKNSTFCLTNLTVENHLFFTPFRGNKRLAALEKWLQSQLKFESVEFRDCSNSSKLLSGSKIEGTELWRPPVMVTALFLIEHAYSHFLHEGLTWRMVLDWMLFSRKHNDEIDWSLLDEKIDEFGFRKFYDSYYRLGKYLVGEVQEFKSLRVQDQKMLDDIWAPLDLHESVRGWKGKLRLAGNTWRARWKYKYFSEDSMLKALWIQTKGVLFEKYPKLE